MNIGGIIQARCSSTRLPDKVLLPLPFGSKITVIEQIIRRTQKVPLINDIIIATTDKAWDDRIALLAQSLGIKYFRGDEDNVLSRFFLAAHENNLETIVRLTGDNPCIESNLISSIIELHIKGNNDFTATKNYPPGLNVEVISFQSLRKAFDEADKSFEKEHVTPYIYTNPDMFKIHIEEAPQELSRPDIRVTLDTEEDYALLCFIFDYFYPGNEFFGVKDIIELLKKKPWLRLINNKIFQKKTYDSLEEEILEAIHICKLQDLKRAEAFLEHQLYEGLHNN